MSCEHFDEVIVDIARGEVSEGSRHDEALGHVEGCVRCAARLEEERAVTTALRAFAARTAGAEAPSRVEAALMKMRALREPGEAAVPARRRPSRAIELLLLAAAAAILAAIVVAPPRYDPRREPSGGAIPEALPALGALPAESEEDVEFIALRYGEDLRELDSLQVVSIELPHTALAALGWPAEDGAEGSVRAEVVVGHDGVARAIRFVE